MANLSQLPPRIRDGLTAEMRAGEHVLSVPFAQQVARTVRDAAQALHSARG